MDENQEKRIFKKFQLFDKRYTQTCYALRAAVTTARVTSKYPLAIKSV